MSIKPLKRGKALTQFSQEHHFGLLLVWKIKEGLKYGVPEERITDYILYFYENDLKDHLLQEETDLFIKLETKSPMLRRAMKDHIALRTLIEKLKQDKKNNNYIIDFSEILEKHIRFEERVMFGFIETKFSDIELMELAQKFNQKPIDISDNWKDKFWITKK